MTAYAEFLATKLRRAPGAGVKTSLPINAKLFAWQADIVRWALRRGRAALFCDTGLGKTVMQLEWARIVAAETGGRVLILAPLAVSEQTAREAEKFGIACDVRVVQHRSDVGDGVSVTNYEKLDRFEPQDFAGIVLDESSILKAFDGKRRNQLVDSFAATPHRLCCTATPAPNDFAELGNHAEFLSVMTRPEMLSMFFVHDGGKTQDWRLKKHAKTDFWRWLCSWSAVVTDPATLGYTDGIDFTLPPLNVRDIVVNDDATPNGWLFDPGEAMDLNARRAARRSSIGERVAVIAEKVNGSTEPWIIWCDLNAEGDALTRAIPDAVQVAGCDSIDDKESRLIGFAEGRIRVLVTKPKIAGFGMNWQHCARMAFCGLSDSYEAFYQAVRRCWRFGQTRPVDVDVVVSGPERVVLDNIQAKGKRADEIRSEMADLTRDAVREEIQKGAVMTEDAYAEDRVSGEGWDLWLGDVVDRLPEIADDSIGYSIFSPPFSSLYTYSASPRDMGNCRDDDEFAEHLAFMARDLLRATAAGRLASFHCMNLPMSKYRDGVIGLRDFRGALIRLFEDAGWIYHSEVCIWKDPVTAMQRTKALGLLHKQIRKDSCMSRMGIADYVVTMRAPGQNGNPVSHTAEQYPVSEWQQVASPIWTDIDPGDTLQFRSAREHDDERHICPLQLEVIRRCLRLWSKEGDLVFSPFAGIGSEGYEALRHGRRFLGVELKRSYYEQAGRNLARAVVEGRQRDLFAAPAEAAEKDQQTTQKEA